MTRRQSFLTQNAAFEKMQKFCAYQERCQQDIRAKLFELGISHEDTEQIITRLIEEGFLDEERFAKAFARGKFRIKNWGKNKIRHELKRKGISTFCIKKGLEEIDMDQYIQVLGRIISEKSKAIKGLKDYQKKYKLMTYLASRGFETELANDLLKDLDDE